MKTPIIVGKYRFAIIRSMLDGNITVSQAEELQRITDKEAMRMIMQNSTK